MTVLTIRPAGGPDAAALAALLNVIVRAGGTTAIEQELSPDEFDDWFISGPHARACHLAQRGAEILGFQTLGDYGPLPPGWVDIGTFTRQEDRVPGVGTALFAVTRQAAAAQGFSTINATIRADNAGGLAFYARLGFRDHGRTPGVPLCDGTPVDRIHRRFDLSG